MPHGVRRGASSAAASLGEPDHTLAAIRLSLLAITSSSDIRHRARCAIEPGSVSKRGGFRHFARAAKEVAWAVSSGLMDFA
jgi:hypothetical protein